MSARSSDLDYLVELTEGTVPKFFIELPFDDQHQLREYVETIVNRDGAALDKLFESMSMMMKFIPNFILHSITPKYIEPPIAAKITNKLTVKQALGITTGLPIDYIGETAVNMDCRHAANILVELKKKTLVPVIKYVSDTHPLKGLDILEHVPDSFLQLAAPHIEPNSIDETCITSGRREVLSKIVQLKSGKTEFARNI